MEYNPETHGDDIDMSDTFFDNQGKRRIVSIYVKECRMKFGRALKFDNSGEDNYTHGIQPSANPQLQFDGNGQPRLVARRNHPRIIQEPYAFLRYGANNDTQPLLINDRGNDAVSSMGFEEYEQYYTNLLAAGMGGLEKHNGAHICEEYLTSYNCKGGEASVNWDASSKAITDEYCSRNGNETRTLRSLVSKHMNEVTNGMSITRDQSQFLLGGGHLKRNSIGTPRKCSVNTMNFEDFVTDDDNDSNRNSFTWKNIERFYMNRDQDLSDINLYTFCAKHWIDHKERPPQFFVFHNKPTWPLE